MVPGSARKEAELDLHVASAGGHLEQLLTLSTRLDVDDPIWVTYDVPQAHSIIGEERLITAHHPTTKNLPNAIRNYRLARVVFDRHEIKRVVSTGAGIAVPFIVRARQLGVPSYYIESATRSEGASLSGRLLQRLPNVHLYRQIGDWGEPRWGQGPCVFDGFDVSMQADGQLRKVVVSLGTHQYAFSRLVERLVPLLLHLDVDVTWQLGSTPAPPDLAGQSHSMLPSDVLKSAIADADVVVGHAGVGLTLSCLKAGKVPVLIPRRSARREHTDDHQAQLARELQHRGLAVVAQVGEVNRGHLERAASLSVAYTQPPPFELVE